MAAPTTLNHRYVLHGVLGRGGMGIVHRATDRLTGREVAIKRLAIAAAPPSAARGAGAVAPGDATELAAGDGPDSPAAPGSGESGRLRLALAHEFQTLARLRHPRIISVLDFDVDEERQPFFVMELLQGARTLSEAARGLPREARIGLLVQVLQALAYLHRQGILHRDLKPGNVLVVEDRARVLDFGLSAGRTHATGRSGTLAYMAPEVLASGRACEASDLYAVGVMTYELLAGRRPFPSDARAILRDRPDLGPLRDALALSAVVARLLSRRPEDRFPDARATIDALRIASGLPPEPESPALRESFLAASALVGRDDTLAPLTAALDAARDGRGSAWILAGESGSGKSRLLAELATRACVGGARVVRGQAEEGGAAHLLWRDVTRTLALGTELPDLDASVLSLVAPGLGVLLDRELSAPPELPDPTAARQRLTSAIASLVRRSATAGRPLVLLLEDLHWAAGALDPLQALAAAAPDLPMLIVGTTRSEEAPELPATLPSMTVLPVGALGEPQVAELAHAILGPGARDATVRLLVRETEGNALFVVETLRALALEAGALDAVGRGALPESVAASGVLSVLRRRLERMSAEAQPLLALAAAAGREVDPSLLSTLEPAADVEAFLLEGVGTWVLEAHGAAFRFRHDRLRDAALAGSARGDLHRRIALVLAARHAGDGSASAALELAHHALRSGDAALERRFLPAAAAAARATFQGELAIRYLERCLELGDDGVALELGLELGAALQMAGRWDAAEARLRACLELATRRDDVRAAARSRMALGSLFQRRGDQAAAIAWIEGARAKLEELGDRRGACAALAEAGVAYFHRGEYDLARARLADGLALARELADDAAEAFALNWLGNTSQWQDDYERARELHEEALAIRRRRGDRPGIAASLNNLGNAAHRRGALDDARRLYEESLALRREVGDVQGVAWSLNNLGNIANAAGDHDRARALFEESLERFRELGSKWGQATVLNNLGLALAGLRQHARARVAHEEALPLFFEMADRPGIATTVYLAGMAAEALGDREGASSAYREGLTLGMESGRKHVVPCGLLGFASLAATGATPDARRAALLSGAAEALRRTLGYSLEPFQRAALERVEAAARTILGEERHRATSEEGARLTEEEAVALALETSRGA